VNYRQALEYLYALAPRGMRPGHDRLGRALALRGHPERSLPSVLVAGTNGKGSVATMVASVLAADGRRVGLFTSPHMHRLVERFRISGRPIAERKLAQRVTALRPFLDDPRHPALTFFEVATLLAFELFRDERCELMVLEVGLGGRLDSTNVVTPLVSVITSIALDHTDRLGPTLVHVAREKAGIIKASVPVVSGARAPAPAAAIRARARKLKAPLLELDRDFAAEPHGRTYRVRVGALQFDGLASPLGGDYQSDNLACAVAALTLLPARFRPDELSLRRGLARVRWPGRLELLPGEPSVLCDAAHNPHAAQALARHLAAMSSASPRRVLLYGAMRDKDHASMIALLRSHFVAIVFTSVATERAESARALAARYGGEAREEPEKALRLARKLAGKRGLVVACGSIFVMAAVRASVLGLRSDPPIAL